MKLFITVITVLIFINSSSQTVIPCFESSQDLSSYTYYDQLHIFNHKTLEGKAIQLPQNLRINDLAFYHDYVLFALRNGTIVKLDTTGKVMAQFGEITSSVNAISVRKDTVMAFAGDGFMYRWNLKSNEFIDAQYLNLCGISSSDIFQQELFTADFCGNIVKSNLNDHSTQTIVANNKSSFYDLLCTNNQFIVATDLIYNKNDYEILLTVFNQQGQKKDQLTIGYTDMIGDYYETPLSLGLHDFNKVKNEFCIFNPSIIYSINDKGQIITRDKFIDEEFGLYLDEEVHFYTSDTSLVFSMTGITNIETGVYHNQSSEFSQFQLENQEVIIPQVIKDSLQIFLKGNEITDDRITPIIQSRYSKITDIICSADTSRIVVINESREIKVYNANTKKLIGNIVADSKVIRLSMHPYLPMFAALMLDGSSEVYNLENLKLVGSYAFFDNEKHVKKHRKKNRMHHSHDVLQEFVTFNNDWGPPITFKFNELGNQLIVLTPENDYYQDFANYNVVDLFNKQKGVLQLNLDYFDIDSDAKADIKGVFGNLFQMEEPGETSDKNSLIYPRETEVDKSLIAPLAQKYFKLAEGSDFISPAVHLHDDGAMMVLDYEESIYNINMRTLENTILKIADLPSPFKKFTSTLHLDANYLLVSVNDCSDEYYLRTTRYIDTSFAKKDLKGQYSKYILEDTLKKSHFDGWEEIYSSSDYRSLNVAQAYIYEYFKWNPNTGVSENIGLEGFEARNFRVSENDQEWYDEEYQPNGYEFCENPTNWSDFLDEDYVMIAEDTRNRGDFRTLLIYNSDFYYPIDMSTTKDCQTCTQLYYDNKLRILQNERKVIKTLASQSSSIAYSGFLNKFPLLATGNTNGQIILWNWHKKTTNKPLVTFTGSGTSLFALTPDNYYMSLTPNGTNLVFRKNGETFQFEQFDLKFNRPDIILTRIGTAEPRLINAYHQAYLKRIKKMGFTEDMLKEDFHLPEIKIENFEEMPEIEDQGSIELDIKLEDSKYNLDRINVWVNDVALYGSDGISIRDQNIQNYTTKLKVNLAKGKNKVQVSVLNQAGAESYKKTFEIESTAGKSQPDLYLITIGESKFQQSEYNLTYAAKDAEDMANLFKGSKVYKEVFTKTLVNYQVSMDNISELDSFLQKADINDQVMIFFAGHGVLSADLDYYLATYEMDFTAPEKKGLAYEDLEKLLDGIKPLQKTLIIDACHSGEIDKDEVLLAQNEQAEEGEIQFRAVGNIVKSKLGSQNTMELTKSLFTDLRKGTGATVISSAGGMEFAMESGDWQNGLFTYALLNGIKSGEADLNQDGEIWLSEIQEYVGKTVTDLSHRKQQPTSRIENQLVDFRVW